MSRFRTGRVACGVLVVVVVTLTALAGCGQWKAPVSDPSGAPASDPEEAPTVSARQKPPDPQVSSSQASPRPRPPSFLADMSEAERADFIAEWGEQDCAPWSLIFDYDSGLLTPEEFTGYAMYPFVSGLPGGSGEFPLPLPVPARYQLCDVDEELQAASMQFAGLAAGLYVEDIDPEFRDRLWLWHTGETYEDATRPLTGEEMDEVFCEVDPEYCD